MDLEPDNETEGIPGAMVREAVPGLASGSRHDGDDPPAGGLDRPDRGLPRPRLMVINRRLIERGLLPARRAFLPGSSRVGVDRPGVRAGDRAGADRPAPPGRPSGSGMAVGLLSFVGFLDVSARLPLELWASLLLSGGLAVQSGPAGRPHAVGRSSGSCAGRSRCSSASCWRSCWRRSAVVPGRSIGRRPPCPPPPAAARNVLLIVWDTVRAGNLSLTATAAGRRPTWSDWPAAGCGSTWRSRRRPGPCRRTPACSPGGGPTSWAVDWKSPLGADVPTLAEYLAAHGYDTAGFVANLDYCGRETGLARGFAHYEDYPIELVRCLHPLRRPGQPDRPHRPGPASSSGLLERHDRALRTTWSPASKEHAKERRGGGPGVPRLALLAAGAEPPVLRVPELQRRPHALRGSGPIGAGLRAPARVLPGPPDPAPLEPLDKATLSPATTSRWRPTSTTIASLISIGGWACSSTSSARRGVLDDTLVIVASDHGEHLGDHLLFFHGCSLYRQLVQVPLVIVDPAGGAGGPGRRRAGEPARHPGDGRRPARPGRDSPFPGRSLARFWAAGRAGDGRRRRAAAHGDGQAALADEPGPRAGRQGPDEVDRRRRDALHPHGRRARGAVRPRRPTRRS